MAHRILRGNGHRTVRISDQPTYLPNASRLGYGKYKASPGDFVRWGDGEGDGYSGWGRVVGRITSHFDDLEDCRGFLVVIKVGSTCAFGHALFVDPAHIEICEPVDQSRLFLTRFLYASPAEISRYLETGYDTRAMAD